MEFVACFVLIVFLIRFKVPVGVTLLIAAVFLTLLEFGFTIRFFAPFKQTLLSLRTWKLILTIMLVVTLGDILSKAGFLPRLVRALNSYISPRTVARVAPALIGLLPMPGGAMVSAPIVEELAKGTDITAEAKTAANFWWRHIWEPVWPLYQSVILAAAILNISVWQVAYICYPVTIICIIAGLLVVRLPLSAKKDKSNGFKILIKEIVLSMSPVLFIVFTGIVFKLDLVLSLIMLFIILLITRITDFKMIYNSFRKEFSFDIIMLFFGGLSLMTTIETGDSAAKTLIALQTWGIPADLVVFTPDRSDRRLCRSRFSDCEFGICIDRRLEFGCAFSLCRRFNGDNGVAGASLPGADQALFRVEISGYLSNLDPGRDCCLGYDFYCQISFLSELKDK
jgi:integral membrane protein (TIGR00529 family)